MIDSKKYSYPKRHCKDSRIGLSNDLKLIMSAPRDGQDKAYIDPLSLRTALINMGNNQISSVLDMECFFGKFQVGSFHVEELLQIMQFIYTD